MTNNLKPGDVVIVNPTKYIDIRLHYLIGEVTRVEKCNGESFTDVNFGNKFHRSTFIHPTSLTKIGTL